MRYRVVLESHKTFEGFDASVFEGELTIADIANHLDGRGVIVSLGPATVCSRGALALFDSTKHGVTDFPFVEADVLHVGRVAERGESAKLRIGRGQQKADAGLDTQPTGKCRRLW
jgi:hypothetical protein